MLLREGGFNPILTITIFSQHKTVIVSLSFFLLSNFQEKRWADFPNVTFNFDCTDRSIGFYADVEQDCMVRVIYK